MTVPCAARISVPPSNVTSSYGPKTTHGSVVERSIDVFAGMPRSPATRFGRRMPSGDTSTAVILWQNEQVTACASAFVCWLKSVSVGAVPTYSG